MRNKHLFVLTSLICGLSVGILTGCSSSNSKWNYTQEESSSFVEVDGYYINELGSVSFIAGEEFAIFNSNLTKDDVVIFDYTLLEKDLEDGKYDCNYLTYDIIAHYKQNIESFEVEEDGTGFNAMFSNSSSGDTFYALVNKEASVYDKFTWVIGKKYEAGGTKKNDVSTSTQIIKACKSNWKYAKDGLNIILNIASCYEAFSKGNYLNAAKGLSSIFTTCGGYAFSDSTDKTKETLKAIDTKMDNLSNTINNNYAQLVNDTICTQMGVEKSILTGLIGQMSNFNTDYVSKVQSELRNINDYEHKYIKDFIQKNQTVNVYYSKDSDGNYQLVLANEYNKNNGDIEMTYQLNSFTNAKAYLSSNNNTIGDGFMDELYKDFQASYTSANTPSFRDTDALNEDVFNSIVQGFYASYYSSNSQDMVKEIQDIRNLTIDFANAITGTSGSVSILSTYLDYLKYTYNFASECKDSYIGTCANLDLLLGKIGALAEIACYYNDTVEASDIESSYEGAVNQIESYMEQLNNLDDNYSFITNKVAEATFTASFYNEAGDMNPKDPYVRLYTAELSSTDDISVVKTLNAYNHGNFINLSEMSVYDITSMGRMYARFSVLKAANDTSSSNIYEYLADLGVIKKGAVDAYKQLSNLDIVSSSDVRFMTSMSEGKLTSEDSIKMTCIWKYGPCSFYNAGDSVKYCSEHKAGNWSGKKATASYLKLDGSVETNVDVCAGASYYEDHWYWQKCPESYCFRDHYSFAFVIYSK